MSYQYKIIPGLSFSFLTPFYDLFQNISGYGKRFKKHTVSLLQLKTKKEFILNVGCGTGTLDELIKK